MNPPQNSPEADVLALEARVLSVTGQRNTLEFALRDLVGAIAPEHSIHRGGNPDRCPLCAALVGAEAALRGVRPSAPPPEGSERHGWTHCICSDCWGTIRRGETPTRVRTPPAEACCWCGRTTRSGIYLRAEAGRLGHCPDNAWEPNRV